ncbi:MAG: type II methionyl aminopeptidase [Candidatus Thorarchaeota archaeon]|jgi:methionyl aminopeptidase
MAIAPHPDYVKAGKIAARVLDEVSQEAVPETKVIKLCTMAETKIVEYGARPAFPCNICIDHIAAHRTSPRNDDTAIPSFGLVKIDVGVHIDGHIVDTALTKDMDGTLDGFIAATDDALNEALDLMRPGVELGEVGKSIEKVIKAYGLRPIKNLTGHNIQRFKLHAGKTLPNTKTRSRETIEEGEYYAIEPYATSGFGKVLDTDFVYIFTNSSMDEPLEGTTEKLRLYLRKKYGPLPFTTRWVTSSSPEVSLVEEFKQLLKSKSIIGHPMLVEKGKRPVSVSEHTVFVSDKKPIPLTERKGG